MKKLLVLIVGCFFLIFLTNLGFSSKRPLSPERVDNEILSTKKLRKSIYTIDKIFCPNQVYEDYTNEYLGHQGCLPTRHWDYLKNEGINNIFFINCIGLTNIVYAAKLKELDANSTRNQKSYLGYLNAAKECFSIAAFCNLPDGQFNLGLMYYIQDNILEALNWWKQAASQSHTTSINNIKAITGDTEFLNLKFNNPAFKQKEPLLLTDSWKVIIGFVDNSSLGSLYQTCTGLYDKVNEYCSVLPYCCYYIANNNKVSLNKKTIAENLRGIQNTHHLSDRKFYILMKRYFTIHGLYSDLKKDSSRNEKTPANKIFQIKHIWDIIEKYLIGSVYYTSTKMISFLSVGNEWVNDETLRDSNNTIIDHTAIGAAKFLDNTQISYIYSDNEAWPLLSNEEAIKLTKLVMNTDIAIDSSVGNCYSLNQNCFQKYESEERLQYLYEDIFKKCNNNELFDMLKDIKPDCIKNYTRLKKELIKVIFGKFVETLSNNKEESSDSLRGLFKIVESKNFSNIVRSEDEYKYYSALIQFYVDEQLFAILANQNIHTEQLISAAFNRVISIINNASEEKSLDDYSNKFFCILDSTDRMEVFEHFEGDEDFGLCVSKCLTYNQQCSLANKKISSNVKWINCFAYLFTGYLDDMMIEANQNYQANQFKEAQPIYEFIQNLANDDADLDGPLWLNWMFPALEALYYCAACCIVDNDVKSASLYFSKIIQKHSETSRYDFSLITDRTTYEQNFRSFCEEQDGDSVTCDASALPKLVAEKIVLKFPEIPAKFMQNKQYSEVISCWQALENAGYQMTVTDLYNAIEASYLVNKHDEMQEYIDKFFNEICIKIQEKNPKIIKELLTGKLSDDTYDLLKCAQRKNVENLIESQQYKEAVALLKDVLESVKN